MICVDRFTVLSCDEAEVFGLDAESAAGDLRRTLSGICETVGGLPDGFSVVEPSREYGEGSSLDRVSIILLSMFVGTEDEREQAEFEARERFARSEPGREYAPDFGFFESAR